LQALLDDRALHEGVSQDVGQDHETVLETAHVIARDRQVEADEPAELAAAGRAKAMAPIFSDKAIEKMAKLDSALNDQLAALIPGGRQVIVEGTGHDIHVDKPEVLITPLIEMIKVVREKEGMSRA